MEETEKPPPLTWNEAMYNALDALQHISSFADYGTDYWDVPDFAASANAVFAHDMPACLDKGSAVTPRDYGAILALAAEAFSQLCVEMRDPGETPETTVYELARRATRERWVAAARQLVADTLIAKQKGYGHDNINRSGKIGVLIRMNDKVARLNNICNNGGSDAVGEAVRETLLDLVGYGVILIMLGTATKRGSTFDLQLIPEAA